VAVVTTQIHLLGGFEVANGGSPVPADRWSRRQVATFVKLLALAPGRRLHREQVIDILWPGTSVSDAGPRLHKVAHYARRALADEGAVLLRNEVVSLLPQREVEVDVDVFRSLSRRAHTTRDPADVAAAVERYTGPLLPDDLYEAWSAAPREELRATYLGLLRDALRWEDVLAEEPADEEAHLALIRAFLERGDTRAAQRQFERLDHALLRELGTRPSAAAEELRTRLATPAGQREARGVRLVGRRAAGNRIRAALAQARAGHGTTLLISGPPGIGKTEVLRLAASLGRREGWRTGRGTGSTVEGPWPYATLLEAFADLCRQHPALLDGLDDAYYEEIERALSGDDVAWSGESGHQRLFVAVAELMRLAAVGHGLMLLIDDLQDADEASLRLLHYLSRCAITEKVVIVVAHRSRLAHPAREVVDGLVRKGAGSVLELSPLDPTSVRRLLSSEFDTLDEEQRAQIVQASGGFPFTVLELARSLDRDGPSGVPALSLPTTDTLQRLALLGGVFTTDEMLALSHASEDETYDQLEEAISARVIEPAEAGYRFFHPLLRERLADAIPSHRRAATLRDVAESMADLGGSPVRLAHLFIAAGLYSRAVPYALRAADTSGALGAYRDALTLIDAVRDHAPAEDLPRLLSRRGDLLQALGDPDAVSAYLEAVPVTTGTEHRLVRARLARAAQLIGEVEIAAEALAGLEPEGDAADGLILVAQGHIAFFAGDLQGAWEIANEGSVTAPADPMAFQDLVTLQGLIAHSRGEWFDRFRLDLRRSRGRQRLVSALFEAHLCVAEYVLYGPVPYQEVIDDARDLLAQAERVGALRGVAFARALIGEAALLMGDLEQAERELSEAVELHHDTDAAAGEAHALQRLAEIRLAQGEAAEARQLLQRALPLARWSMMAKHLMHRIYGTMIAAAPTPEAARAVVDQARATLGDSDDCGFCVVMFAVPAAIACAQAGDLDSARELIEIGSSSTQTWPNTAWAAGLKEARAHVALADGDPEEAASLLVEAVAAFDAAGQPADSSRCGRTLETLTSVRASHVVVDPTAAPVVPLPSPQATTR
jgi:DNA-binding SARP family transcriptional activator/tetratricopeptide (TPR) repeat protein